MAVESLFSTIHCSLFFCRAGRTSLVCVAFRSFLLSIVEHILSLYDNASSHELHNYCPRLVMKNWLTSIQISHCGESGHYITLIAQDKMSNLKKTLVKKTSHLMQRSHQACTLWPVGAVTNPFMDFHSCLLEKVRRCFLISSWQDLRKITIPKLSTMQGPINL